MVESSVQRACLQSNGAVLVERLYAIADSRPSMTLLKRRKSGYWMRSRQMSPEMSDARNLARMRAPSTRPYVGLPGLRGFDPETNVEYKDKVEELRTENSDLRHPTSVTRHRDST